MQPPTHPIVFSADDGRAIPLTGSSESSASDKDVVVHLKNPDDSDRRGSLIVSHPLQVVFKNLSYTVRVKQKGTKGKVDKPILKGCNGVFQPGRFCGILGASGAGKTTLLNLLAGQATVGRSEGSILVNGEPANASLMRKVSGFVFQDDVILETMTVREALTMSALLRLPPEMAREAKLARVTEIISVLHLEHASDTIVGSSTNKGISGGERKRAACGMEMIVNPGILFLDEPTSGLDTFTATAIVETLKGLAASGRTVAATLHQPSSEIFHMFDDLCLMASGRIMYFGPVEESVPYFAALGYPCPTYTNPADHFFMKILNTHRHTLPSGKQVEGTEAVPLASERIEGLLGEWPQSRLGAAMAHAVERPASGGVHEAQLQRRARLVTQFEVLTKRTLKNVFRNRLILRAKFGQMLFMALLCGLIYLRVGTDQYSIQNRNGAMFFIAVNNVMSAAMGVLSVFGAEKIVFRREHSQGMYNTTAFFLSKIFVEAPFQILLPWLYSLIIYWMIGFQNTAEKYFIFAAVVILMTNCGYALGIFIAALCPELEVALVIAPVLILPLMIFSGFFVNNGGIPVYFDWIKYISPMKYGFEALVKNEYGGLYPLTCDPGKGPCMLRLDKQGYGRGDDVITALGMANDNIEIWACLLVLLCIFLALLLFAYLSLVRVVRKNKL
eukprot:tig00000605_g2469.t1